MDNNIAIIDNFDSFTFNIVHLLKQVSSAKISVQRNNAIDETILDSASHIIFSPGPGVPKDAGKMMAIIDRYKNRTPMLGVCLGHQALAEYFGGALQQLHQVHHGIRCPILFPKERPLFFNHVPQGSFVGRYHSWAVDELQLPDTLRIIARDEQGTILAIQHQYLPIVGVQFHPESILTEYGEMMLQNFLSMKGVNVCS